jgi:hypothetical protein
MIVATDIDSYSFGNSSLGTSASCSNANAISIGRFGIGGDFTRHSALIESATLVPAGSGRSSRSTTSYGNYLLGQSMDSVGITNNGRPVHLDSYLSTRRFRSWLLQPSAQTWELLYRICPVQVDMLMQQLNLHSAVGTPEVTGASMQASDAVVQAPSGAMYSQFAKRYNQVPSYIYRQDWWYLMRTGLGKMRDNTAKILRPRYPKAIPPRTSGMLEITGLKIPQNISSLIQSLGIPKLDNVKFQCSRFSMNPSLQIMGSTDPIVVPHSGITRGTTPGYPWSTSLGDPESISLGCPLDTSLGDLWITISMHSYLDFPSSRSPALAQCQRSMRNTPEGTPSSSILVMPEAVILGFHATCKHSTCQVILSNTILETATPLIPGCSARSEMSNPAKIWPGIYICPFGRDMILATFLSTDITNIEPGEYSQTLIEGVLQLSLPFPSFHVPLQMILKPPSFLGTGAAGMRSVARSRKLTAMDIYDGIFARRLWVLQSDPRISDDSSSQNWTLENLAVDALGITINIPVARALEVIDASLMEILEAPAMYRQLRGQY